MRQMEDLHTIETIDQFIKQHKLSFIYISRTNCSVCHALLPQVKKVMQQFPDIHLAHVNADDVSDIAGRFSIFTVPVLLLFVEGKEYYREARFVHIEQFEKKVRKIYEGV